MDQARAELEAEYFARFDYVREAYGPSAIDSAAEAEDERIAWEAEREEAIANAGRGRGAS